MSSEKYLVCQGAMCQCKFGTTPDVLKVSSQDKYYINDSSSSQKLVGNTMDLGSPLKAGTFGSCKKMNNNPCKPAVTQWKDFYDKVVLKNGGKILTEESKATCAVAGSPCIEFTTTGQMATVNPGNAEKADEEVQQELNPLVEVKKLNKVGPFEGIELKSE
ncbi:DUF4280 domain-containing protein [Sinomicrobium sp. M5D2P17]